MLKILLLSFLLFFKSNIIMAQDSLSVFKFNDFLLLVLQNHPVSKQANLTRNEGDLLLKRAKGAFDPNLNIDYDRKNFDGKEYFDVLNTQLKIPVWYGIDIEGGFERNEGIFLNPERNVPQQGLFNAGISVALGRGMIINERMAVLQKAKAFQNLSRIEQILMLNKIVFEAATSYFNWLKNYKNKLLIEQYLENATLRHQNIIEQAQAGEIPFIDTVESGIIRLNRIFDLEQNKIEYIQSTLALSNFLWNENNIPLEINDNVAPENLDAEQLDNLFALAETPTNPDDLNFHPRIKKLIFQNQQLEIDKRWKAEQLKPTINLKYNFLNENAQFTENGVFAEYKLGATFQLPLFLRKERADYQLAKLRIKALQLEMNLQENQLRNQINNLLQQNTAFLNQMNTLQQIANNYQTLTDAENTKFQMGESSVFFINAREQKLIESLLKLNETENKFFKNKAEIFQIMATDASKINL